MEDAFDRAVAREEGYRWAMGRAAANSGLSGVLMVLAMIVVPLPLHLWLVEWDSRAPSMMLHLVALTAWVTIVAIVWLGERAER